MSIRDDCRNFGTSMSLPTDRRTPLVVQPYSHLTGKSIRLMRPRLAAARR